VQQATGVGTNDADQSLPNRCPRREPRVDHETGEVLPNSCMRWTCSWCRRVMLQRLVLRLATAQPTMFLTITRIASTASVVAGVVRDGARALRRGINRVRTRLGAHWAYVLERGDEDPTFTHLHALARTDDGKLITKQELTAASVSSGFGEEVKPKFITGAAGARQRHAQARAEYMLGTTVMHPWGSEAAERAWSAFTELNGDRHVVHTSPMYFEPTKALEAG
jgi:hypothetical protein